MNGFVLQIWVFAVASWLNRGQQNAIEYLVEENRVLREQLGRAGFGEAAFPVKAKPFFLFLFLLAVVGSELSFPGSGRDSWKAGTPPPLRRLCFLMVCLQRSGSSAFGSRSVGTSYLVAHGGVRTGRHHLLHGVACAASQYGVLAHVSSPMQLA